MTSNYFILGNINGYVEAYSIQNYRQKKYVKRGYSKMCDDTIIQIERINKLNVVICTLLGSIYLVHPFKLTALKFWR